MNTIQDTTNKEYLMDHRIIEWKFQINRKASEKIQKSRRDLTKINKEHFNIDLKINLEIDMEKTLQQNLTTIWMPLKRQWINTHH